MAETSRVDDDRSEFRTNLSLIKNVRDPSDVESCAGSMTSTRRC